MISVIVPVYNVEKYLDKCINSLLNQNYDDYEIILVDDGSPDKCPQICDEYKKKYPQKIRALHKTNGGLSDARNYGVSFAKGDFVTFIDSDDWVESCYLSELVRVKDKYNADISAVGIKVTDKTKINKINNKLTQKKNDYYLNGEEALIEMLYQHNLDTSACAILIPKQIAQKFQFPKGKYHEDEFTTYKYYFNSKIVAISLKPCYFYYQRSGSIMHDFGKASMDELEAADNLVNWCNKNCPRAINAARSKKFSDYCQVLLSTKILAKDTYNRITYYLKQEAINIIEDRNTRKKNKAAAYLIRISINLFVKIGRTLYKVK